MEHKFRVELLSPKGEIERVVALSDHVLVARGEFQAAVMQFGDRNAVRMRHGARVVEMHPPNQR